MRMQKWLLGAALGAAVLGGCSKDETPAPAAGGGAGGSATQPSAPAMGSATQPSSPAPAMGGGSATQPAAAAAGSAMGAATAQADKLMAEAKGYISSNNLASADGVLKQLQTLKSNLPANYQSEIDSLQKLYDAAKSGLGGMTIPKMP